ncbi:MAG: peptide chain release factor 1 [Candidatus Woesearchaeota archaeon]|nr:peptide chain release factor aRF-1 [Nanoarchaeota archaeon]USN44396.1 MAG: peptide chain release factor 1 [Candidatus Woesearchaeota archaeon]
MGIDLTQRLKLRKFIKNLLQYRGRHTELVSVYIPAGYDITKIVNNLQDEQGTATNIKDAKTSKSVISALERMIRSLKTFSDTPKNGLAIFSGNVSDKDNVDNFQVFWIEPPEPLNLKLYRCDQKFIIYPLDEMDANETTYGLIAIDKGEATVGLLIGSSIKTLKNLHSNVPGKFKAGGQSAQRFARIREGAAVEFYKRVADVMIQEFTFMTELKGLIVGGPGTTKNNFVDGTYMNEDLKKKIKGIKDITYTNSFGLKELVDKSEDVLSDDEIMTERRILQRFLETLGKDTTKIVYGVKNTTMALEMGAVEDLIIIDSEVEEEQLEKMCELQEQSRSNLHLVTDRTPEGVQFKALGGIGAILRYPIST